MNERGRGKRAGRREAIRARTRRHPGSTAGRRDINLRYQRVRIEEADERDYAAARPGEHECIRTTARCARTARMTALAPVRLLLYNNYRLIKICYLTLR